VAPFLLLHGTCTSHLHTSALPNPPLPQIDGGFVADEAAALELCLRLESLLRGGQSSSGGGGGGRLAAAAAPPAGGQGGSGFRALAGGPVVLDDMGGQGLLVHTSDVGAGKPKQMIQVGSAWGWGRVPRRKGVWEGR
jgi:hypothetical protein